MCNSLHHFLNRRPLFEKHREITIPDTTKVTVDKIGEVQPIPDLLLTNVLFVPQFRFNLISIHKLCILNGVGVSFTN